MDEHNRDHSDEPCYVISVAARLVRMHAQTLRYYERQGLVKPSRSNGNLRLYSARDIERLQTIRRLINDLGVNLAGAQIILNQSERIAELRAEVERLREQLRQMAVDTTAVPRDE